MAKKNLTIKQIARIAVPLLRKNDVVKAGIFGSYARGEMKKKSDRKFLVRKSISLNTKRFTLPLRSRFLMKRLESYEEK